MKSSFCIDLQRFMLIPTKFPLSPYIALLFSVLFQYLLKGLAYILCGLKAQ